MFITKTAAARILTNKQITAKKITVKKIWFMSNGSVGVSYTTLDRGYSTILSRKLFLQDAIKIRQQRSVQEKYMVASVKLGSFGDLPKQVSVKFSGSKDYHIVSLDKGISCDCEGFKSTINNEFNVHPICSHLFPVVKSFKLNSVAELMQQVLLKSAA